MSNSDDQNLIDEDAYVIEDTEESLETFDLAKEEAASNVEGDARDAGEGGIAISSAELTRLQNENAELKDRVLRSRADFDNFRKRAERERADHFKYALADFVRELLPVIDNFERALSANTDSAPDLLMGVELIYKQLSDVLSKAGLKAIEDVPAPFDPTQHEAVAREENAQVPNHTVTEVMQKGYVLNDRLVRPAMVKVAVGGADDDASAFDDPVRPFEAETDAGDPPETEG